MKFDLGSLCETIPDPTFEPQSKADRTNCLIISMRVLHIIFTTFPKVKINSSKSYVTISILKFSKFKPICRF